MSVRHVRSRTLQLLLVTITAVCFAVSLIEPPHPREQMLQHIPTVLVLPLLFWGAWRGWLSNGSMICVVLFLLLHVLGARYIYSNVPYGETLGFLSLDSSGLERNHYDRLVHLAFGVLAMPFLCELAIRRGGLSRAWARGFAVCVVAAVSGAYEVFEWLLTVVADPAQADRYNGQQGDMWDAQKDMALAVLGSLIALPLVGRSSNPERSIA